MKCVTNILIYTLNVMFNNNNNNNNNKFIHAKIQRICTRQQTRFN
jgi:hypothetical protein